MLPKPSNAIPIPLRAAAVVLTLAGVCAGVFGAIAQEQAPPARLSFAPAGPAAEVRAASPEPPHFPETGLGPAYDAGALPINLPTALRLAMTTHLDIAQARQVARQADIALERAQLQILPTLNLGSVYTEHEGNIAKTEGNIIKANKDALFVGGGPSLSLSFTDALYGPLVARQVAAASEAGVQRVRNNALLGVAEAYFAVLRARRRLARVDATLDFLTSDRPAPTRAGSRGLLLVVEAMQEAGAAEALKAEVYRVRAEVLRRREERVAALQDLHIAVAELARQLRLDPQSPLWPVEDFREPLPLPGPWYDEPVDDLVRLALNNRPELAESQALVQAADERIRAAQARPLLPNVVLNYNWGDFGGAPDTNPTLIFPPAKKGDPPKVVAQPGFGPSGRIHHFGTRSDFDVALVWKLPNLGLGNYLEIREQEALARQANFRRIQLQETVIAEVVATREAVLGWAERVNTTRAALFGPNGQPTGPVFEAIRLNFERVREIKMTRPLEVLDSIRGLNDLLEAYGQAVTDYERARFRLLVVLGLPPEEILGRVLGQSVRPE
jgi:outer membrane protein TolC